MKILITGAAGFIGFHLTQRLCAEGHQIIGVDNLNTYYSLELKKSRLEILKNLPGFEFILGSLEDPTLWDRPQLMCRFDAVVNLAAQAGVRYSLENPLAYVESNLVGFARVLEHCRKFEAGHLVFASSSSVYGMNTQTPFSVHDNVDHPVSLYAATKKSNELMAHSYSHLYNLPTTGLRFFTVYGPWGRPDMAYFKFTKSIIEGSPLDVYNEGNMYRDFTYVEDVVEGLVRVLKQPAIPMKDWSGSQPDPATSSAPYRIYNLGNSQTVRLSEFIETLEELLGIKAEKRYKPLQPGDVLATAADVQALEADFGWKPSTPLRLGLRSFISWYKDFYHV